METFEKLLLFAQVLIAQKGKMLRLKARNGSELEYFVLTQGIANAKSTFVRQSNYISRISFIDDFSLISK